MQCIFLLFLPPSPSFVVWAVKLINSTVVASNDLGCKQIFFASKTKPLFKIKSVITVFVLMVKFDILNLLTRLLWENS